jgi:hypothetical protein
MLYCSVKIKDIIEDDKIRVIVIVKNDFIKKDEQMYMCTMVFLLCTLYVLVLIVVILAEQGFDKQC